MEVLNLIIVSYRDDHAAALARVAALEGELARTTAERDRLRDELARTRAQRFPLPIPMPMAMYVRPVRTSGVVFALRIGVLIAIIGAAVLAMTAVHQPARATHVELVPVPELAAPLVPLDALARCADVAARSDAPAPCRPELARWARDPGLPSLLRTTLLDWLVLEQALDDITGSERDTVVARRGQLLARLHPD